jgi:hypothetical protein
MALEFGILSTLYNIIKDLARWLYGRFGPKDPVHILEHRTKWKSEFEKNIELLRNQDVIIRDLARMDSYPEIDEKKKGISSWLKVEFKDLYHRGFEVFLRVESIKYLDRANGWVFCDYKDEGAINAFLVGRIPYDVVRKVDWSGDEYYRVPHIYCDFKKRLGKEPYEEIIFCERHKGTDYEWFDEIAEYGQVRRLSKKFGCLYGR